jgi:hypothetical protein
MTKRPAPASRKFMELALVDGREPAAMLRELQSVHPPDGLARQRPPLWLAKCG